MSWSAYAVGKSAAVRTEIARQFISQGVCVEPEESIRKNAQYLLDAVLAGQNERIAVKVSASGYQNTSSSGVTSNSLSIIVEPLNNFVE